MAKIVRDYPVTKAPQMEPTHPGKLLGATVLPALDLSVTAAARALGISRQSLHAVLAGKASVTPEMALRVGKLCGNGAHLWLGMQQAYDLWHAERAMREQLAAIETRQVA
jgi:addiction module HigA family antidote